MNRIVMIHTFPTTAKFARMKFVINRADGTSREYLSVIIEGIPFELTGNSMDDYDISAQCWTWEDGLVWLNIYDLERLGEVIQEHYQVLADMEERKVKA